MIIRRCEMRDANVIHSIYSFHVVTGTASFELEPPSLEEMTTRVQGLLANDYPFLVGTVEGQVICYSYAGPYRVRPAYRGTVETSIYLQDDMRNRGYGKQLLSKLVDDATIRGFRQMVAIIGDAQNAGSIAIHAATGFMHIGTLKSVGYKHGKWLDTVIMQRSLGEGDRTSLTSSDF